MDINAILSDAVRMDGSDVFIVPGSSVYVKVKNGLIPMTDGRLAPVDTELLLRQIYKLSGGRPIEHVTESGDDDFSFALPGVGRFRCNAYKQRGSLAAVLRVVTFTIPDPAQMGIPENVVNLYKLQRGMILVTGPAGSGKSTTQACIIDRINADCADHIVTIEDPIEFLHPHKQSIVSQREINLDTQSYAHALRAALRQAPNVIFVGEMRDLETISTALTAAETGHLLLSTLHTVGAAKTINRIIDVFPPVQQQQIQVQLSMALSAVVSQQLLPTIGGGLVPAFEVMIVNSAIRNLIREGKIPQIDNVIYSSASQGMFTMDANILRLFREKQITRETALMYASNPDTLANKL